MLDPLFEDLTYIVKSLSRDAYSAKPSLGVKYLYMCLDFGVGSSQSETHTCLIRYLSLGGWVFRGVSAVSIPEQWYIVSVP